jgi:arylsulfatase A-like enzyme
MPRNMLVVLFVLLGTSIATAQTKPNVVLIVVDDMGYSDLGCYGSEIKTPNIDRLAVGGIRFTNFTNCAKCETTRATLMSGRYHPEVGGGALRDCITMPQVMKQGGYHTMMVGKWHLDGSPMDRGFDRYFGFLNGASNFFTGESTAGGTQFRLGRENYKVPDKDFYCTDDFTNFVLKFLDDREASAENKEKPFFLYVAYNAPHYPLQAPKEEVEKYLGKYMGGWDTLRKTRLAKMKKLGIVPADQKLSTRPDVEKFESLPAKQKEHHDLMMAIYAGMIDRVDQNVGRLLAKIEAMGETQNTLILFLSDNGACPFQRSTKKSIENNLAPWDPTSFWCYDERWAHACNTPWRKYKQNQHEGGVSTPLIAFWPKGIVKPGRLERQRGHLVDLHATFCELVGVDYPVEHNGSPVGPARGISLAPLFKQQPRQAHTELFYYFNSQKTALLQGEWKLVDSKELYRLPADRIEGKDLSKEYPERFEKMKVRWAELAKSYGVNPRGKKSNRKKKAQP